MRRRATQPCDERRYPTRPWVGVGAVVLHQGRVLLVQRGRAPGQGWWAFPGGVVDLGETVYAAARRELAEETGLQATPLAVVDVYEYLERDAEERVRYHYVIVEVLLQLDEPPDQLRAADDAAAVRWFALDELEGDQVGPGVARVVARALAWQKAAPKRAAANP